MKRLFFTCSLLLFTSVVISSCEDNDLAKQAEGTWTMTAQSKDDEGNPMKGRLTYQLKYVESDETNGGTFTESQLTSYTEEAGEYVIDYQISSTIKGEWEVIWGDLFLTYKINTLDVKVTHLNCRIADDVNALRTLELAGDEIAGALSNRHGNITRTLTKEARKSAYRELRRKYIQDNEDMASFSNLSVSGDTLSLDTEDMGRIHFHKVTD